MKEACFKIFKVVHNDRPDRYYQTDYTKDFQTQCRPLQAVEDHNPHYYYPEYGNDPRTAERRPI